MEKFSLCAQLVTENLSCIISEFGRGFQAPLLTSKIMSSSCAFLHACDFAAQSHVWHPQVFKIAFAVSYTQANIFVTEIFSQTICLDVWTRLEPTY